MTASLHGEHDPVVSMHAIVRWVFPLIGIGIIASVLLDVVLIVLYARLGSGIIGRDVSRVIWRLFRALSTRLKRHRAAVLSFSGPVILVAILVIWFFGLAIGFAFIILPALGTGVRATAGPTSESFATAFYIAGDSMTTVGMSDYAPQTAFYRIFYVLNSFTGISVLTLSVTYLLEIYNALQSRNMLATKLHLLTSETGDAASLLAGIAPEGRLEAGLPQLTELAAETVELKESHNFFPALFYFKFVHPHYSLPRIALVMLDTVTLIKSGFNDREFSWLKKAGMLEVIWRDSMHALTMLASTYLPAGIPQDPPPDAQSRKLWEARYRDAIRKLAAAGIPTMADEEKGAEIYVSLRSRWDRYITTFAAYLADEMEMVDVALHRMDDPDAVNQDPPSLHNVG